MASFQDGGISLPLSKIDENSLAITGARYSPSFLYISTGRSSGPAALFDFPALMEFLISPSDIGQLIASLWAYGGLPDPAVLPPPLPAYLDILNILSQNGLGEPPLYHPMSE